MESSYSFRTARVRSSHILLLVSSLLLVAVATSGPLWAQTTTTTSVVTGTVTDPSGAVVPGATLTLVNKNTNQTLTATTDASGHYVFPAVAPGPYTLRVTAKGFQTTEVSNLNVVIGKPSTVNVTLQIGEVTQTVQVTASTMTELQTTNASVGEVLSGAELQHMPVIGTSAAQLIFIQPTVAPNTGDDVSGGQIAGARSEQVTFYVDGGDATSDLEGSNNYVSPNQEPGISPVVPVPIDAIEEFRVATNNTDASLSRSSGGQVTYITRSGTNNFHGRAFEYYTGDALDANGWTRNRVGIPKPHSVDNRFGASADGPIIKNKLFFAAFYEGRRFHEAAIINRVVPTDTLKQGILRFKDASGNIVSYNFNPANGPLAALCGSSGNSPCDPRNIGISPVIKSQLALYPAGNNASLGDGLNTTGLTASVPTPIITDIGKLKLNYNLSSKWSGFVTWQYARNTRTGTEQISILGTPHSVSGDPYYSNFYTFQVQGQLSPNFVSVTHGSFLRNWWAWARTAPTPLVPGTNAALQVAGEGVGGSNSLSKLLADPININTQQARSRIWDGHDWYIAEDATWVHAGHTISFGGSGTIWHDFHLRTDNVLGGLTTGPIYYIGARGQSQNSFVLISSQFRPPTCSSTVTTNCIQSGDVTRWNGLYAAVLGLLDHSSQIQTRDGDFNPNPLGTPLFDQVTIPSFTTYFQDVWKATRNLTITMGVDWGVALTPSEKKGKEVVLTYADSHAPFSFVQYLQDRVAALGAGQPGCFPAAGGSGPCFNPTWGLIPVRHLSHPFHDKMRITDWHALGPRAAVAWQVPMKNWLFGDHQTVIRGGYALVFDRTSAVNQVLTPLLTGGLADADVCGGPVFTSGGGFACSPVGVRTNPTNAYRIGVDGSGPGVPPPTKQAIPFIPPAPLGLFLSFPLDPYVTPGYAHSIDFTVQRALPHNMFLELGYVGRFSRNLPQSQQLTAAYYLMKDPFSGQTLAEAFDAVAQQLRAGVNPGSVTPQPFFENLIGPPGPGVTATAMVAQNDAADLINGDLGDFAQFELNFDAPAFFDNMQILEFAGVTSQGFSNYNAGFLVFRKAFSHGLQFQADWTWSHAIGNQGFNQQYVYSANSPYNLNIDRASEVFDRRHVFHFLWYYDLPFGTGRSYRTGNGVLDRIIGGWNVSGIFTAYTGLPVCIFADGNYGAWLSNGTCAIPSGHLPSLKVHSGVSGSGGIGTAGATGLNAFANPAAVFNSLSYPLLSKYGRVAFDQLRAFPYWNLDLSVSKNIAVTERYRLLFRMDSSNIFNTVIFATPSLDLGSPSNFGVINAQGNSPREIQLSLRFEF
jgi:hypothetical protein